MNHDLFQHQFDQAVARGAPLADRLRPTTIEEFEGQANLVGPGKLLRQAIEADQLPSMIFWGPPGSGKTTLAAVIARLTRSAFVMFSAVTAGMKELRSVIGAAEERRKFHHERKVLFLVHH